MHFLVTIWKEKNCRKHWKEQKLITKVMEFFLKGTKFGNKILEEKIDQFQKMKKLEKFFGRNNCKSKVIEENWKHNLYTEK